MLTLSLFHIVELVMVAIEPWDTSMPKQQLSCDDKMIGLGVSHSFMTAMSTFFPLFVLFLYFKLKVIWNAKYLRHKLMFVILVLCSRVKWFYVNACEDIYLYSVFLLGIIWWPWASVVYINLLWSSSNYVRHPCPNNNSVVIIKWLGWVSLMVSWLL